MNNQSFNILLADDDPAIRTVVSAILHRRGHTVEVVDNGQAAIGLFSAKPGYFDILITDHNMPVVSGLELAQYLRKSGFQTKIIVISGSLSGELQAAYRNKGVDKILQKPFMLENLSSSLNDILGQWKEAACA